MLKLEHKAFITINYVLLISILQNNVESKCKNVKFKNFPEKLVLAIVKIREKLGYFVLAQRGESVSMHIYICLCICAFHAIMMCLTFV